MQKIWKICHDYRHLALLFSLVSLILPAGALFVPSIEWQERYGYGGYEGFSFDFIPNDIVPAGDGGYYLVTTSGSNTPQNHGSYTTSLTTQDIWIIKFNRNGTLIWEKWLGGTGDDEGSGITATSDGGFAITGRAGSDNGDLAGARNGGGSDLWVVKFASDGTIAWQKTFGGSMAELGRSIRQTPDGGFIIVGETTSDDGDVNGIHGCYVFASTKIGDLDNAMVPQVDPVADNCIPNDFNPIPLHFPDIWMIRLDASGILLWQKTLGGSNPDNGYCIRTTDDGGYILAGTTNSSDGDISGHYGHEDAWVVKLDPEGNKIWDKNLGGGAYDYAYDIVQTGDGGYIVVGKTSSIDGDVSGNHGGAADMWIVKLDRAGNLVWQKTLGGSNDDKAHSIAPTDDGNYLIVGQTQSLDADVGVPKGATDIWVLKIDPAGEILWQTLLSGPNGGTHNEYGNHGIQTPDRGFIITGITQSRNIGTNSNNNPDVLVVKLSGDGSLPVTPAVPIPMETNTVAYGGAGGNKTFPTARSPMGGETVIILVFAAGLFASFKKQ